MVRQSRERYRQLPGTRRGFLFGSSVWLGSDHLLLVNSARFRETYRRFYFRDIQAIVSAGAPRFHVSSRSALIGALWLIGLPIVRALTPLAWIWYGAAAILVGVWAYISALHSCRTRIHTAVSSEELRSLYRNWTYRRFLEKVEPYIIQAQGTLEGESVDAVEDRQIGALPEGRVGLASPAPDPARGQDRVTTPARAWISILFVASLVVGGAAELSTLGISAEKARYVVLGFILLEIATAVAVLIQDFSGRATASLRNLAIVAIAATGIWCYALQMGASVAVAYQNRQSNKAELFEVQSRPLALLDYPFARGVSGGIALALGIAGMTLLSRRKRPNV